MSPRQVLLCIALALFLGGLAFGLTPRSVGDGTTCGSLFVAESLAFDSGGQQDSCDDKRSDMRTPVLGALGLAGMAFIAAFVAPHDRGNRAKQT